MCGKCDKVVQAVACGFNGIGVLLTLVAGLCHFARCAPMGTSPRGLAVGAGLALLAAISVHVCKACCIDRCHTDEPQGPAAPGKLWGIETVKELAATGPQRSPRTRCSRFPDGAVLLPDHSLRRT